MKMQVLWRVTGGLCALALLIMSCSPGNAAPAKTLQKLTVCHSAVSTTQSGLIYALRKGFFARHGLEIELLSVNGGSTAVATLLSGQAQLCQLSPIPAVAAARAGEDLQIIAGIVNVIPYSLLVRTDITAPAQLAGKTIAVRDLRGTSDFALRSALQSLGVNPASVKTVSLPSAQAALAAMVAGTVDGTVLQPPENLLAAQSGFVELPIGVTQEYQHTSIVARKGFVAANRPAMLAFVRALGEGIAAMQADEAGSIALLADFLKLDPVKDHAALKASFDLTIVARLNSVPRPSRVGIQFLIDQLPAGPGERALTFGDMADVSIVEELERNGHLRPSR